jgi:hypothetical protein
MVTSNREGVGRGFWLQWVIASAVGGIVVAIAALIVTWAVNGFVDVDWSGTGSAFINIALWDVLVGLIGGLSLGGVGTAQWLVLQRHASWAGWWVLAIAGGGALAGAASAVFFFIIGILVFEPSAGAGSNLAGFAMLIIGIALGVFLGAPAFLAAFGLTQWLILRRRVARSAFLVFASTVGMAACLAVPFVVWVFTSQMLGTVGGSLGRYLGADDVISVVGRAVGFVGVSATSVAMYGAISGGAMVWLLWRPIQVTEAEGDHDLNGSLETPE